LSALYSERFVVASAQGVYTNYQVPVGRRAVLRSILAYGPVAGVVTIAIAGFNVWSLTFTGGIPQVALDCRLVVYGGELMQVAVNGNARASLSGYLFREVGSDGIAGRPEPVEEFSPPGPLPV